MNSLITQDIKISVETFYQEHQSMPLRNEHLFAYRITIKNQSLFPVQLMTRKWVIFDSLDGARVVEGEGVVGQQPIIQPNDSYQYVSGCHLNSEIGRMSGQYLMKSKYDNRHFTVYIPEFDLVVPSKMN